MSSLFVCYAHIFIPAARDMFCILTKPHNSPSILELYVVWTH